MTGSAANSPALVVFAKEPTPGRVKTRLASAIGAQPAADVYRELTALTLAHAGAARRAGVLSRIEVWCSPHPDSHHFRRLAAATDATLHHQADGDLGARMTHALADALTRTCRVLLIGTDCPWLDPERLALAATALASHDAVLGPAEDGGFVLVGACRPLPFAAIRWSSPHSLADTCACFDRARIRWMSLAMSWDVDEPADLARWRALRDAIPAAIP